MQKWKLPSQSQDPLFQRTYLKPLSIQLRCPGCHKLYRIDTRDLRSSDPQFDCLKCHTTFTIENKSPMQSAFVAKTVQKISSVPVNKLNFVEDPAAVASKPEGLKRCPKCEAFNPLFGEECQKCGVIFAKLENLSLDSKLGALPSLVRAWQDLMQDYSNVTKHMAFVDRCDDLQAVPFALKKYQDLKEAQPQDEIAKEMLHRTMIRAFAKKAETMTSNMVKQQGWVQTVNWSRVFKLMPFGLSVLMILIGLSQPGLRNLTGIGVSLVFITLGMALFFKGRLHWEDFWN